MFENAQVGDNIIYKDIRGKLFFAKIEKATPKQVVVKGIRFWRDTGNEVGGDGYYTSYIFLITPELEAAAKADEHARYRERQKGWIINTLHQLDWSRIDDKTVNLIAEIAKTESEKQKG